MSFTSQKYKKKFYLELQRDEKCAHGADDSLYWRGDDDPMNKYVWKNIRRQTICFAGLTPNWGNR